MPNLHIWERIISQFASAPLVCVFLQVDSPIHIQLLHLEYVTHFHQRLHPREINPCRKAACLKQAGIHCMQDYEEHTKAHKHTDWMLWMEPRPKAIKQKQFPIHEVYDRTCARTFFYNLRGIVFLDRVSVCVGVKDNPELTSNSLVPSNNTSESASFAFEASWMKHARWHVVNKSLVEASVAVAHLVRLCIDPGSDQSPRPYYDVHDKQDWEMSWKVSWKNWGLRSLMLLTCVKLAS